MVRAISPRTRLVVVVNPDSPSGDVLTADEVAVIRRVAAAVGAVVVVDEVYHHFGAPSVVSSVGESDDLVVLRSFSKAWGLAGVRVGFLVAAPGRVAAVARHATRYPVSAVSARIVEGFLDRPEVMRGYVDEVRAAMPLVDERLTALGCTVRRTGASWVLVELPAGLDRELLQQRLRVHGIEVSAGLPDPWAGSVRVTVGPRSQMAAALDTWAGVVAELELLPTAGAEP